MDIVVDVNGVVNGIAAGLSRDEFCAEFITRFIATYKVSPSYREIADAIHVYDMSGTNQLKGSIRRILERLQDAGKLTLVIENGKIRPGGIFVP